MNGVLDQYRGIALLEVLFKLLSTRINLHLTSKIEFHHVMHGFYKGKGTGMAIMGFKLQMQLARGTINPHFMVFLDLK
jgi:hypothetical protein